MTQLDQALEESVTEGTDSATDSAIAWQLWIQLEGSE